MTPKWDNSVPRCDKGCKYLDKCCDVYHCEDWFCLSGPTLEPVSPGQVCIPAVRKSAEQIADLRAEVAEKEKNLESLTIRHHAEFEARKKAERERDELRRFAQHLSGCQFSRTMGKWECDCGRDAALLRREGEK